MPCSTRSNEVCEVFVSGAVLCGITDITVVLKDACVVQRCESMLSGVSVVKADPLVTDKGLLVTNDDVIPAPVGHDLLIDSLLVVIAWENRLCVVCGEVTVAA